MDAQTEQLIETLRNLAGEKPGETVCSAGVAHGYFHRLFYAAGFDREHFAVLGVDGAGKVLGAEILTTGNESSCIVDPKMIFSWALRLGNWGARSIIMSHCHPSGLTEPSRQDLEVTRRTVKAGNMLGIQVHDHLILSSKGTFCSLVEHGVMPQ